jgi:hypothetical protein
MFARLRVSVKLIEGSPFGIGLSITGHHLTTLKVASHASIATGTALRLQDVHQRLKKPVTDLGIPSVGL